jgi:uncharacterized membrane protein YccC
MNTQCSALLLVLYLALASLYSPGVRAQDNPWLDAERQLITALQSTTDPAAQQRLWGELGQVLERQYRYAEAIEAYQRAGDGNAVARVRMNQQTALENARIEAENERIRGMQDEANRLEAEMKALEGGRPPPR